MDIDAECSKLKGSCLIFFQDVATTVEIDRYLDNVMSALLWRFTNVCLALAKRRPYNLFVISWLITWLRSNLHVISNFFNIGSTLSYGSQPYGERCFEVGRKRWSNLYFHFCQRRSNLVKVILNVSSIVLPFEKLVFMHVWKIS